MSYPGNYPANARAAGTIERTAAFRDACPNAFAPSEADVERLLARAAEHPLGTAFVRDGAPDAVAATFGVHAFTVDRARETLRQA